MSAELEAARKVVTAARLLLMPSEGGWGDRFTQLAEAVADYNEAAATDDAANQ